MSDEAGYAPMLAFDTDDPEFSRGFEAGRIWTLMALHTDEPMGHDQLQHIYSTNTRLVKRMAAAKGLRCRIDVVDEDWAEIRIEETP